MAKLVPLYIRIWLLSDYILFHNIEEIYSFQLSVDNVMYFQVNVEYANVSTNVF